MLYPWLTPLLAAIACLTLSLIVIVRGPRNELGRVFSLAGAVLASFNLFYFVLYFVEDYWRAFYLARVFRVGSFLTTPVGVHLAVALRQKRSATWDLILALNYSIAAFFILTNIFDLYVDGLIAIPWGYTTTRTKLYEVLTLYTLANASTAIGLVIYQYQTATDPRAKLQSKFWMLGITAGISLGLTNFLPAYGVPIYPLGHFGSVAFAAILAYAIVRHRLMGIEVAVTKGIAYAVVVLIVVAPAFAVAVYLQHAFFGRVDYEFSLGLLVLLLGTGVVFPWARRFVEKKLESSLFRETRESRAALRNFAKSTVRIINEDDLVDQLCETVLRVFNLDRIALFLMNHDRRVCSLRRSLGADPTDLSLSVENPLFKWLEDQGGPVLVEEVDSIVDDVRREMVSGLLLTNSWNVCVPLLGGSGVIGFVGLGKKANVDAFVKEDLDTLEVLGAEASIAFENARLYDELRRSHEIIGRAGRLSALGTFAAGIAHEVRNPLVSIQTFFQLAPRRIHDEEFMTSFLPLAEQELVRIRTLITELLSFAKSPNAVIQPVSVSDVVDRALTLLSPHARKEEVNLVTDFQASPDIVDADPEQLMQVLVNIVLNAIQASPEGGTVGIQVSSILREGRSMVRTTVRDEGQGIPEALREAIFNPFFTTKEKGTGLGLSIVHRIVVDTGGTITVEDSSGHGACFAIEFPTADRVDKVVDSGGSPNDQSRRLGGGTSP